MAQTRGAISTIVAAGTIPPVGTVAGSLRSFVETVTYAAQAAADTIVVGTLPKGARLLYGMITTSVTTGAATIAVGIAGTTAKYKAAAAFTAVDTPTFFGTAAGIHTQLAADETILITVAAASLPASGTLQVLLVYVFN